jgi:hypothetical protein
VTRRSARERGKFRRVGPRALACAAVALTVVALSGCTAEYDAAIRLVDGSLVFASCDPASGNAIRVRATSDAEDTSSSTIWLARSDEVRRIPDTVALDAPIAGFTSTDEPPDVTEFFEISVSVQTLDDRGRLESNRPAFFRSEDISSKYWLAANGSRRAAACPA